LIGQGTAILAPDNARWIMRSVNPLTRLSDLGQSVWMDFIQRGMLRPGGEIERLIREDGLSGLTSNPALFEKAINGSSDYDPDIRALSLEGRSTEEIYETMAVEDVRRVADLLRETFDATRGADGYVSIEVSPRLALDAPASVAEARRLVRAVDRPNLMVKIPGTKPGLVAIRQLLREGVNINITLLFGVDRYREVHEAFLSALEERKGAGERIDRIASVASFFLSRIDTLLDPAVEKVIASGGPAAAEARGLPGTIAIANAKLAWESYQEVRRSERWEGLSRRGARPQRLLWASTGTKNPAYSDTHYVEPLIAPETVNTMPLETLKAYRDHGRPEVRIEEGLADAHEQVARLERIGLSIDQAAQTLEEEGIKKFVQPLLTLLGAIDRKRRVAGAAVRGA
jgi:transaldolase